MSGLRSSSRPLVPALITFQSDDKVFVTYRVRGPLRRWWHRRTGWSTEWTVEHDYVPLKDMIPRFTAKRGMP